MFATICCVSAATELRSVERIKPSTVDPDVTHYDDPNVVIANPEAGLGAPLVVFLPGTHGRPENAAALLQIVAAQGYRVIGLEYDDEPSVSQVCPRDPDPACAAAFRQMRIFGDGTAKVGNPPAEAIVPRLTKLLVYLDAQHPADAWGAYLDVSRKPAWDRIVVSGLSQGAGMAAYIAKQFAVKRVVLFSSPWDTTGSDRHPSPWLAKPSATPLDRWWAERHVHESTTDLISNAYTALEIPRDHILLFDRALSSTPRGSSNPFHGSTVRDVGYEPQWKQMFGTVGP